MAKNDEKQRSITLRAAMENVEPTDCWVQGCLIQVTNAHSIQEGVLKRIADSRGRVITVMPRNVKVAANPNPEKFTKLHISKASAGTWSCNPHDQVPELENREPDWHDPRANFLLAFRAALYGNWVARYEHNIWEARATAFPSEVVARGNASFLGSRQASYQAVVDLMASLYHKGDYGYLCYRTREVKGAPVVACSNVTRLFQAPDGRPSFLTVTVYPTERGHVVSVAFPVREKATIEAEFQAFSFGSDTDFEEGISEVILINPYNTFLSPECWSRFSEKQKNTIYQQVRAHEGSKQLSGLFVPPPKAISMFNLFREL